jgi:hypothetical protein
MKEIPKVAWKVVLGFVILLAAALLTKGVFIGSTVEIKGHVSGTAQPIYRRTCRYLSLNGIERQVRPPRLSEGGRCPLIKWG